MGTPKRKGWMPTAHAPAPALVRSLANAGWGELGGHSMRGRRVVLDALVKGFLNDKSGSGRATEEQLAEASQYSVRWVRACLNDLEDLGVISWTRGGYRRGRGIPSFFTIVKTRLVELITAARKTKEERVKARAAARDERIAKSGAAPWATLKPKRGRDRSACLDSQPEVVTDLLTPDGGGNDLPQSEEFQFQPDTPPDIVRRVNEAATNAKDEAKRRKFYGVDRASMADASVSGDSSGGARDALAQIAGLNPILAGKIERRRAARERKKQRPRS